MTDQGRIICGDATQVLSRFPADSVELAVTSPPYYRHRDYRVDGQFGIEPSVAEYVGRGVSKAPHNFYKRSFQQNWTCATSMMRRMERGDGNEG